MLHDRDYMRSSPLDSRRSLAVSLIVVLILAFVAQEILFYYTRFPTDAWFALSLEGFKEHRYWQLLTFQFMHGGFWHLLFNCIGLYFLGKPVEETLGKKSFLTVYFAGGIIGGIVQLLVMLTLPGHTSASVVGASAGISALLAVYAMMFPMQEFTYFLYFFPITIRAIYLFWFTLLFNIYGTIKPDSAVAYAAHLGGLLTGVAYFRWGHEMQRRLLRWGPFQKRQRKFELVKAGSVRFQRPGRPAKEELPELPSEEFISKQVDPILDKISAHGIQSLTQRERQILEAARARMSKR